MIDFIESEKAFKEYLKAYDSNNGNIKLKITHTYGVVTLSEYIAKSLNLDSENIELAKLIALLHDIGRFEQVSKTNTFVDSNKFDHADYGVKVLFEENLIRKFVKDNKYDDIIYKAILNHNKYAIEDKLNDLELLHSKIIRDADKVDNFRVKETEKFENIFPGIEENTLKEDFISDKVYSDFINHKLIKVGDRKTKIDYWICILAFIFDLYFDASKKYIKDKDYIDSLIDKYQYTNSETKRKMESIRKCANDFLDRL